MYIHYIKVKMERNYLSPEEKEEIKKIITPKWDYCFKHIFGKEGNEDITKRFLNLFIDNRINEINLDCNTNIDKSYNQQKNSGLDIKAKLDGNTWVDIEIQVDDKKDIEQRILYYWSKLYANQLKKSEPYKRLQKTIAVLITAYEIDGLKEIKKTLSKWKIREDEEKYHKMVLTKDLEFYIIEIPKLKKYQDLDKDLARWVKFIDNPEVLDMSEYEEDKILKKAEKEYEEFCGGDEAYWAAEAELKAQRDRNSALYYAQETGLEEGRKKGMKEGMKEGMKQGAKSKQIEIAKNLLKENIDIDIIIKATGLRKGEIEKLKNT